MTALTDEEKRELSKHKYLYEVTNDNDTLNVYKRPVVYISKKAVYYKSADSGVLENVQTGWVRKNVHEDPMYTRDLFGATRYRRFFWEVPTDLTERKDEIESEIKVAFKKQKLQGLYRKATILQSDVCKANEAYTSCMNEIRNLEKELGYA